MSRELAFELHALVARLDRAADRLLQEHFGVSYRRFFVLFAVEELGAVSQRALAQRLDVSEPSVSRMVGVLRAEGLLEVSSVAGANRRRLGLTKDGRRLVRAGQSLLADRLADLVAKSGVPGDRYLEWTRVLSAALQDADAPVVASPA